MRAPVFFHVQGDTVGEESWLAERPTALGPWMVIVLRWVGPSQTGACGNVQRELTTYAASQCKERIDYLSSFGLLSDVCFYIGLKPMYMVRLLARIRNSYVIVGLTEGRKCITMVK